MLLHSSVHFLCWCWAQRGFNSPARQSEVQLRTQSDAPEAWQIKNETWLKPRVRHHHIKMADMSPLPPTVQKWSQNILIWLLTSPPSADLEPVNLVVEATSHSAVTNSRRRTGRDCQKTSRRRRSLIHRWEDKRQLFRNSLINSNKHKNVLMQNWKCSDENCHFPAKLFYSDTSRQLIVLTAAPIDSLLIKTTSGCERSLLSAIF